MTLGELLEGIEIVETNADMSMEIGGISMNSKETKAGEIFVCICGVLADGHNFAHAAAEKGAVCAIIERDIEDFNLPFVKVFNSRKALAQISANFYNHPASKLKIIGITGTNGKTTVTYLVKAILEAAGHKVGLIGTNRNMLGDKVMETQRTTPDSLQLQELLSIMVDEGMEYLVMEVSSHALDMYRVEGIEFEVGAFTNLTRDHLDYHGTMENYFQAKCKLFEKSKVGVVNVDDEYGAKIASMFGGKIKGISARQTSDIYASDIVLHPQSVEFVCNEDTKISLNIPGKFSVYNALVAIGICRELGCDTKKIADGLSRAKGVMGRAEVLDIGKDYTVIIDYAHTPDGLENILKTMRGFCKGRLIVLFGCGGDRDATKRPIMGAIAAELADFCVVTSDNPRSEESKRIIEDILAGMKGAKSQYTAIESRFDAIKYALENARKDDIIVLAGKGHETYQILKNETIHFDEREVVKEIIYKG